MRTTPALSFPAKPAEEIATPSPDNRMVGFPYTKLLNANMQVDQAAALLLCSVDAARVVVSAGTLGTGTKLGDPIEVAALQKADPSARKTKDSDYVFITFILTQLPIGLIGITAADKPLDLGRRSRTVKPKLRRHVLHRDGKCTVDGCPFNYRLEVHHIRPRGWGGDHDPDNLITLCWYHHHIVIHQQQYTPYPQPEHGRIRFRRPERAPPESALRQAGIPHRGQPVEAGPLSREEQQGHHDHARLYRRAEHTHA